MSVIKEGRKTYSLRDGIPPDVYKVILREQGIKKTEKGTGHYSLERTIYHIIREFDRMKAKEVKK